MNWFFLILAGFFEVGWPLGLKLTGVPGKQVLGWTLSLVCLALSGYFLWLAQKSIPMGTAYAVWTGIGTVGAFAVGVVAFGDAMTVWRLVSVTLILGGVVGLKLAH